MKHVIHLTQEMFNALLSGKQLIQQTPEFRIEIYPPHYGLYLTRSQIREIENRAHAEGARETIAFLLKIQEDFDKATKGGE